MSAHVLLTRPVDDSSSLADILSNYSIPVSFCPILDLTPVSFKREWVLFRLSQVIGLIVTSRHVFLQHQQFWETLPVSVKDLPVYAVGSQTVCALKNYFKNKPIVCETAQELAHYIAQKNPPCVSQKPSFLWLRGRDYTLDFDKALSPDVCIDQEIVYKADARKNFPLDIISFLDQGKIKVIPFYSKRTAETFESLLLQTFGNRARSLVETICVITMSQNIAQALTLPWGKIEIYPSSFILEGIIEQFRQMDSL